MRSWKTKVFREFKNPEHSCQHARLSFFKSLLHASTSNIPPQINYISIKRRWKFPYANSYIKPLFLRQIILPRFSAHLKEFFWRHSVVYSCILAICLILHRHCDENWLLLITVRLLRSVFHSPNIRRTAAARIGENWAIVIAYEVQILKTK